MAFDFDLFVIGGGSGGIAAATGAAKYGAKVAIAETKQLGGTCVNRGCIPKKLMVYASEFSHQFSEATAYGWTSVKSQFNWSKFIASKDREIQRLQQVYQAYLDKAGVEIIRGRATFIDPHTIAIADRKVTADKILIAVGGKPVKPPISGIEHALTSDDMFHLEKYPQRLLIVGGGYIGVEFSCMMNSFGSEVTLIDNEDTILQKFDRDLQSIVQREIVRRGIKFKGGQKVTQIEKVAEGLQISFSEDSDQPVVDAVLIATGRSPNIENLGLEKAGVKTTEKGAIALEKGNQTSVPHIFAVGDCTSHIDLTPIAIAEGRAFADTQFGNQPTQLNYDFIPTAVFAQPQAASVGMTEETAREKVGNQVKCYCNQLQPLYYRLTEQDEEALIKLVVDSNSDRVLGVHIVGQHAAEMIQGFAIALNCGATKQDFDATIAIHPTLAEETVSLK